MQDTISITDLSLRTRLGITPEERIVEQQVLVSVEFPIDASKAGKTDDLNDTVDYADVYARIRSLAETERKTVERLAEDIAQAILQNFPLTSVMVTIKKFPLPDVKEVSIRIHRQKP